MGAVALLAAVAGCGSEPAPLPAAYDVPGSTPTGTVAPEPRLRTTPGTLQHRRALRVLSNGCSYTTRGIPACGALVGAAFGGNHDPAAWERSMGRQLGVRRTYFAPDEVDEAVDTARHDLDSGRVPWMSFKLPHSWEQMRDGAGDAWARSLAERLSTLDGPVWLALHHEPEGDGDVRAWTAMQARLAPIVRERAPNVAYSIILTGWNQLHGERRYSLRALWPAGTEIDLLGFDTFDKYGAHKDGTFFDEHTRLRRDYFPSFGVFARQHGVAWGIAETGHTDAAAAHDPTWIRDTYESMVEHGGVAFTYFNSTLNSSGSWHLSGVKERRFARLLRTTPSL
jgi:hypothetical protein